MDKPLIYMQVLCNVHRTAAQWCYDHLNYEPVYRTDLCHGMFAIYTPIKFS